MVPSDPIAVPLRRPLLQPSFVLPSAIVCSTWSLDEERAIEIGLGGQGIIAGRAQACSKTHLDRREAHPAHAVRGAAVVFRVEQEDAAQDEERCRVRARDDLQARSTSL